jgi:hypothetical protein
VPAKPAWYGQLDRILADLRSLPRPYVDRATIELLLGVGRRRAQQILAPCVTGRIGSNGLADREVFIERLLRLAQGDDGYYEIQRRRKFARLMDQLRQQRIEQPQLLVEAPAQVVNQGLEGLPAGVEIEPGRITVDFEGPQQALEKLLALAMAVSNDFDRFERQAGCISTVLTTEEN